MRIVLCNAWWPMCVGKYLLRAARRAGHEVRTVGPTSGDRIDVWEVPLELPGEGVDPDISGMGQKAPADAAADERKLAEFADWADLWLDVDGGWFIYGKIPTRRRVLIATDPHCASWAARFDYREQRGFVDETYTMQGNYRAPGDKWLPYAYDPEWFWPEKLERTHDVTNLGASYPERCDLSDSLAALGLRVLGPGRTCIGDAHRRQLCAAPVAIVWPLSDDLPCRVFEGIACGRVVLTRMVPDLRRMQGFDEAIACGQVLVVEDLGAIVRNAASVIASAPAEPFPIAPAFAARHTWDARLQQVIDGRSEP